MGIFDNLTGKNIEMKLNEYCEVYGEVLLGIHRETTNHKGTIKEINENVELVRSEIEKLNEKLNSVRKDQESIRLNSKTIKIALIMSTGAFILSILLLVI
jgi:septation ring formation regulator EzrA